MPMLGQMTTVSVWSVGSVLQGPQPLENNRLWPLQRLLVAGRCRVRAVGVLRADSSCGFDWCLKMAAPAVELVVHVVNEIGR